MRAAHRGVSAPSGTEGHQGGPQPCPPPGRGVPTPHPTVPNRLLWQHRDRVAPPGPMAEPSATPPSLPQHLNCHFSAQKCHHSFPGWQSQALQPCATPIPLSPHRGQAQAVPPPQHTHSPHWSLQQSFFFFLLFYFPYTMMCCWALQFLNFRMTYKFWFPTVM